MHSHCDANSSSYRLQTFEIASPAIPYSMGGGTPHKNFLFFRFLKTNIANITKMLQKSATEISPVPLSSKFHGESESDNQNIDLYRKTIQND